MELGEILKLTGVALAIGSAMILVAGALWQRRTSRRLGSNDLPPLKRKRLIWRAGESPYYAEAQPDTPLSSATEGEEPGARVSPEILEGREASKPQGSARRRPKAKRRIVNLYLSEDLYSRLRERCRAENATVSERLEKLIAKHLGEGRN